MMRDFERIQAFYTSFPRSFSVLLAAAGCAAPRPAPLQVPKAGETVGPVSPEPPARTNEPSPHFVLEGQPFCFQGTNNYYLSFQSKEAAVRVLDAAAAMNLPVIRTWAFHDRGSLNGEVRDIHEGSSKDGVYFQYWDKKTGRPAYNDAESGLARLDFVLHSARERGQKLILVLTNSWRDYGGMDQYLVWFGLHAHHQFYTDERVKGAFKEWAQHLVTRVNSVDGVAYRDDPAIFGWELANEPRTLTLTTFDSPDGWDSSTLTRWADEMSSFLQELDPNHLVSVGDEGFLPTGGEEWTYSAPFGVDSAALTALPGVDFGTYHLYPDHWGVKDAFGLGWISSHIELARRLDKPTLLEEYGTRVRRESESSGSIVDGAERRRTVYASWNDLVIDQGGAGALFWMLAAETSSGVRYPDYDRFTLYPDEESARLLGQYGTKMSSSARACELARVPNTFAPSPFVSARGIRG